MIRSHGSGRLELMGDNGMLEKFLMARSWRNVRVMSIFAGTNEIRQLKKNNLP
jgi:alkylation response protein AidB-like acyl-CoA dehydrogenase